MAETIIGRNAVLEALKGNREIEKITLAKGAEGSVKQIAAKARDKHIPIYYSDKARMDKAASGGAHQGVIAVVSDYKYCTVDDILARAAQRGEDPFIIILDGLEDPHNLGAIMRTAECAGVHGIVIPKRRSVSVTETVAKTSAGAVEYMLCAKVTNIANEIEKLKDVCKAKLGEDKDVFINIVEIKQPDLDSQLVAENIAGQLERRVSFRRALKQAIGRTMKLGARGIKIQVSGRLGGAEIARTEQYHEGTIPLQTMRADIDYGFAEAKTTYGRVGVKVWLYKGEVLHDNRRPRKEKEGGTK